MRIGLAVPQLGRHATQAAVRGFVLRAEEQGFDSLWVQDHFMWPREPARDHHVSMTGALSLQRYQMPDPYRSVMQPLELLAYAAALTERVQLGTSILVTAYHRPLRLARQLSTIDELSGGRVLCGLGLGAIREEFEQMDTPFAGRGRRMDDFIDALRASWREDPVEHHGPFFDIPACDSGPKPVQRDGTGRPAIPVLIGAGDSKKGQERIARMADGWVVTAILHDLDEIARYAEQLRALRADTGRTAPLTIYNRTFVLPEVPGVPTFDGGLFGPAAWQGTVGSMVEKTERMAAAGIDHLVLDTNYWEVCPSPDAWVDLVDALAPLVDVAHGTSSCEC